jgi:pyruvate dehydrogenase E2 component (dihydrolipoamide acetyltransferase)
MEGEHMQEVTMPKLSNSMEVGQIISWRIREGEAVKKGDIIAEIETDKAVVEMESPGEGILARIVLGEGTEVEVGKVIAYIGAVGEAVPPKGQEMGVAEKPGEVATGEAVRTQAGVTGERQEPRVGEAAREGGGPGRVSISPAARKLAEEKGIDVSRIQGTGPGGRITTSDVEKAAGKGAAQPAGGPSAGPRSGAGAEEALPALDVTNDEGDVEEIPFRVKAMVRRVTAAKQSIPHFYMTSSVDVTALMGRAEEVKAAHGATVTHLVMWACVRALAAHPEINRSYDRGRLIRWKHVNLGLAIDTEKGLTVGVISGAEGLTLEALVRETQGVVAAARTGELSAAQRRNPTFTISNLGMLGVEEFAAIINPPSSVTLAVAAALDRPVVRDGQLGVGKVMKVTMSCDHRVVDGATAARFLRDLKALLEDPGKLLEPLT